MKKFRSAVILAGGKSTRMEFDKQCLIINENRLIYDIANKLEKNFDDIIIVSNKKQHYKDCKYKVISDEIKDMGPLAGISVGLRNSLSEFVYIVGCDNPNIDNDYISYLKNKIEQDIKANNYYDIYICIIDERIQLFQGFYNKKISEEIEYYLLNNQKKSIISFLENTNKKVNYIRDDEFNGNRFNKNIFINLNTKEDLDNYLKYK